MTVYAWPTRWWPERFELRVAPNLRTFTAPYAPSQQSIDLLGERWQGTITLPPVIDPAEGAAREAFFDRLKGQSHQFAIWHFRLPVPQGTLRDGVTASVVNGSAATVSVVNASAAAVTVTTGTPVLSAAVAQLANTATLRTIAGRTVKAGDMLGISGQLVRVMADATADGAGALAIEFQPRAREAWAQFTTVTWNQPTCDVMLRTGTDGIPTQWAAGLAEGVSFDFTEVP